METEVSQNSGANNMPNYTTVIVQEKKSNGLGTAGFIVALCGIVFCWVPVLDWILWFVGLVLSFIGVFKAPRGLAIAGLVLSFIGIIILIAIVGTLMALAS